MIETILLSTAIAFSMGEIEVPCPKGMDIRHACFAMVSCQAFEEVFNFDWEYPSLENTGMHDCPEIHIDGDFAVCKKKKVTSRTLLGLCQDGVVRWKEEK